MRRRFKIAFVILLASTIVWMLAWHQHIIDHKQMVKEWYQNWLEENEIIDMIGLPPPFWAHNYGSVLTISGFIICIAWVFFLEVIYKDWRKEKDAKNEKVGWVAKALKTLASLLILMFFFFLIILYYYLLILLE